MKQIKKIKIHNKLLLLISLVFFFLAINYIINEVIERKEELISLNFRINTFEIYTCILILVILQFLNWFLEAVKFRNLFFPYEVISLKSSIYSVYVGNFTSFFTPDRIGSFVGRILFLQKSSKLMITAVTALGNLSQLIITILFMLFGTILHMVIDHDLIPISNELLVTVFIGYFIFFIALINIYFKPAIILRYLGKWQLLNSYIIRLESLDKISLKIKMKVLFLSMFRYLIFYLQYYILLKGFHVNISGVELLVFVGLLYGVITFIPSPFMGNFGTREALAIYLATSSILGLFAPVISFFIWMINVGLSTLIGGCIYSVVLKNGSR